MTEDSLGLNTPRAKKARTAARLPRSLPQFLLVCTLLFLVIGVTILILPPHKHYGLSVLALSLAAYISALWLKWDLLVLEPDLSTSSGRLTIDVLGKLRKTDNTPRKVWDNISSNWQSYFFTNRLMFSPQTLSALFSENPADLGVIVNTAAAIADQNQSTTIELGYLSAAFLKSSPAVSEMLTHYKLNIKDVDAISAWLARTLESIEHKPAYGGIGRDWAFGFTNFLNRFAYNISDEIIKHNLNFGWLTDSADVIAIEKVLVNRSGGIVLIGPTGIGKTSRVYALAQRMMEGKADPRIAYHQILELDGQTILANANKLGGLENLFLRIVNEAGHAGHITLFLDDAERFFNEGPGALNAGAILQPVLQSRAIQLILTLTPEDYQRLRFNNQTVASLLTPVILQELPEASVMRILEDSALGMESRFNCVFTYGAIKNAYRLSGRYIQDEAYPGKAIKLLEQSVTYTESKLVTADSVDQAIEHTLGVRVSQASQAEAGQLLNLEDRIHQRMINQNEAVNRVSAALRRARAGVANPKRPVGSFLFLGPTGVGKTELAKAIASEYFGNENNMVRLDMSEFQQESDVSRLLSAGSDTSTSFLMNIRRQPSSVVLLDEVEKSHPNILNLLLQLLDEGTLTDVNSRPVSFKDSVIIATSNAGATQIQAQIKGGGKLDEFKDQLTDQLILANIFKPELLNRFDEIILFRSLTAQELAQVVRLLMIEVNQNLNRQNISVELSDDAVNKIVAAGSDERYGARPMRRALQRAVEDPIAKRILSGEIQPGQHIVLNADQIDFTA